MTKTAEQLRQEAAAHDQDAADSFERCDTDGFVSQWASGITAREKRLQADIVENGGLAEFMGLFDLDTGARVRAKVIDGKYGLCWAFCDADDKFTGQFVSAFPKREATMAKKGYREDWEQAPARATIVGSGTGLSGAATCRAVKVRTDEGYPPDAVVQ